MKKIKITCTGSRTLPVEQLKRFQGNLKELSEKEFLKLKSSILKYGFSFPVFVWEDNIIDGHQRVMTVLELLKTGEYEIDEVPVVDIEAKDKREAAEKLLVLNSQYAKMTYEGLYEFGTTMEIDFESVALDLNLPDIDIENFLNGYVKDVPPNELPDGSDGAGGGISIKLTIDSESYLENRAKIINQLEVLKSDCGVKYEINE